MFQIWHMQNQSPNRKQPKPYSFKKLGESQTKYIKEAHSKIHDNKIEEKEKKVVKGAFYPQWMKPSTGQQISYCKLWRPEEIGITFIKLWKRCRPRVVHPGKRPSGVQVKESDGKRRGFVTNRLTLSMATRSSLNRKGILGHQEGRTNNEKSRNIGKYKRWSFFSWVF